MQFFSYVYYRKWDYPSVLKADIQAINCGYFWVQDYWNYRVFFLSKNFWIIFPSFVHLLANKHMAKQSRASGQLSGGHWVEYRVEFWLFFSSIFQNFSNFLTVLSFLIFLKFSGMRFSFPSIWEYSKHFQSNFYVPALLASIKLGLAYINQPLC